MTHLTFKYQASLGKPALDVYRQQQNARRLSAAGSTRPRSRKPEKTDKQKKKKSKSAPSPGMRWQRCLGVLPSVGPGDTLRHASRVSRRLSAPLGCGPAECLLSFLFLLLFCFVFLPAIVKKNCSPCAPVANFSVTAGVLKSFDPNVLQPVQGCSASLALQGDERPSVGSGRPRPPFSGRLT